MSYAETISLDRRSREAKDRLFSSTGFFCFSAFLRSSHFSQNRSGGGKCKQGYCKQPPSSKPSRHFHFPTTAIDPPSVPFTGVLVSFRRQSLSSSFTRSRRHPGPPVVEHKFYSCPDNFLSYPVFLGIRWRKSRVDISQLELALWEYSPSSAYPSGTFVCVKS